MFEDATFETMGTIHTRSRNWMLATFGLNASILAALIAIPLFYPSALPQMVSAILMEAPAPVEETRPVVRQAPAAATQTEFRTGVCWLRQGFRRASWIPSHDGAAAEWGCGGPRWSCIGSGPWRG